MQIFLTVMMVIYSCIVLVLLIVGTFDKETRGFSFFLAILFAIAVIITVIAIKESPIHGPISLKMGSLSSYYNNWSLSL